MKGKNLLIAGGSGNVGQSLLNEALKNNYNVAVLTRRGDYQADHFKWNPTDKYIDPEAMEWADVVVNLAGAGIADKRWTEERKRILTLSRTSSTSILVDGINAAVKKPKVLVQASAIGYYGNSGNALCSEDSSPKEGEFLSDLCVKWENAAVGLYAQTRLAIIRIGVVLSYEGGMLDKMLPLAKLGLLSSLGNGRQWLSWIHEKDLARMMLFMIENEECAGPFNAVAPIPVQNKTFTKALNKALSRPNLLPPVPSFALKTIYGEMSQSFLGGQQVSNEKIQQLGFRFEYDVIIKALKDLVK